MRPLRAALVAALAVPAIGAAPQPRVYVIERVGDRIAPDTVIGSKRAGLACLPDGRIRWSDIGAGGPTDRRELVQDVLEDAGLPIATLAGGGPLRRQIRLRGIVTAATADLCAKNMLGRPSALSGATTLTVEWRGEAIEGEGPPLRHVSTITRRFEGRQAASLGAIGRALLEDAARDLATWLQADGVAQP